MSTITDLIGNCVLLEILDHVLGILVRNVLVQQAQFVEGELKEMHFGSFRNELVRDLK